MVPSRHFSVGRGLMGRGRGRGRGVCIGRNKRSEEGRSNLHPSLSSWCEGNVDESSVVLSPLPCFVSHVLFGISGRWS